MISSHQANAAWYEGWVDGELKRELIMCSSPQDLTRTRRRILSAANVRGHIITTTSVPGFNGADGIALEVFYLGRLNERRNP